MSNEVKQPETQPEAIETNEDLEAIKEQMEQQATNIKPIKRHIAILRGIRDTYADVNRAKKKAVKNNQLSTREQGKLSKDIREIAMKITFLDGIINAIRANVLGCRKQFQDDLSLFDLRKTKRLDNWARRVMENTTEEVKKEFDIKK